MEQLEIIGLDGKYDKNGGFEGEQSLRNKRSCVFHYDKEKGDFVHEWIDRPDFIKKYLDKIDQADNEHTEY